MRSLTRLCCALAVIALPLVFLAFPSRGAAAAALTVNTLADTPDALSAGLCADANAACTLRAAIRRAGPGQVIDFSVTGTIHLGQALPELTRNVTISGPGSSLLTVRRGTGVGEFRIFTVRAGAAVAISGLTISNGKPPGGYVFIGNGWPGEPGGGIFNGGTLTLTGCVISGNTSARGSVGLTGIQFGTGYGNSGSGGGIYNAGTLNMNDCTVSDNRAAEGVAGQSLNGDGGGVYSTGELNMANCTVSNNSASFVVGRGGSRSKGSGVYAGGVTRITNSVVRDNRGGFGGGIYNTGHATVEGSVISGNSTGDGTEGFGVSQSGDGGGGVANVGIMIIDDCTVSGNRTGTGGGGGNSKSGGHGGGIFNGWTMTLTKSTVVGNVTGAGAGVEQGGFGPAGSGGLGGGVYNSGALTVTNSVVAGNTTGRGGGGGNPGQGNGGDGGGIASPDGAILKLSNSTVVRNQTGLSGGGGGRDGLGGGVFGGAKLRSTIISTNFVRFPNNASDVSGAGFESFGHNFIEISGGGCCFNFGGTDRAGSSASPGATIKLNPVTLVPQPGSVAIDAGLARDVDDRPLDTDRRGAARPFDDPTVTPASGGDDSDIGAFERQGADPQPPLASPATTVHFSAPGGRVTEGCVQTSVAVVRSGPLHGRSEVDYVVSGRTATQRGDFVYARGHVTFNGGDEVKSIPVLVNEDAYAEGPEELTVTLTELQGGTLSTPNPFIVRIDDNDAADGASNPIDDDATFVGQHYHDFLSRQADAAGLAFWTNQLAACAGDAACLDRKREDVSAAFFLSIEFQQTGYFAIRVNKAAFGDRPENPRYLPFLDETQQIGRGVVVGRPGFEALLDFNKQHYAEAFVARADFQAAHGGQDAGQYVDSLFANTRATPTQAERDAAVSAFGAGDNAGRARALRSVVESGSVYNRLYNPAFVLMQYFAYLRRDADGAPDDSFAGYDFWLAKLDQFTVPGEDARDERVALSRVRRAEMVRAFLLSAEYRGRFQGDPNRGS